VHGVEHGRRGCPGQLHRPWWRFSGCNSDVRPDSGGLRHRGSDIDLDRSADDCRAGAGDRAPSAEEPVPMNLVGSILKHAKTSPDAPAIIEHDRALNYGELGELIVRTSAHLATFGVRRGDQVGLCLRETTDNIVAFLAAAKLGAVTVPLDWRASEREHARL